MMNDVTMKSSVVGGGNPLNIVRIGGNTEYYNTIFMNDLNGTISVTTLEVYTPVWNRYYTSYRPGEATQWNKTSTCKWFGCDYDYDFLRYDSSYGTLDKSLSPYNQGETNDTNSGIRIIIEFKE